jgi:hypothetical protein
MNSDLPRVADRANNSSGFHWSSVLALLVALSALFLALRDHTLSQESLEDDTGDQEIEWIVASDESQETDPDGISIMGFAPVQLDDLLRWHDLRGFRIQLSTSGTQQALGTRFAFYQKGELLVATEWHWDFSQTGQQKTQELSILFHIDEDAGVVNIWRRLQGAGSKLKISFPAGFKAQLFPSSPRLVNGYQIPLAVTLAPNETWAISSDFNPNSSHLILVMELMEYIGDSSKEAEGSSQ